MLRIQHGHRTLSIEPDTVLAVCGARNLKWLPLHIRFRHRLLLEVEVVECDLEWCWPDKAPKVIHGKLGGQSRVCSEEQVGKHVRRSFSEFGTVLYACDRVS